MRKTKCIISFLLVLMLVFSMSITSLAKPNKIKNQTNKKQQGLSQNSIKEVEVNDNEETNPEISEKKLRKEIKKSIKELKEAAKKAYSQEEIQRLEELVSEIKTQYPGVKVLPVENIISKNMNMKFDTPPVIKEGRTLIPVRALTQAFGANVSWNGEEKKVTIVKDDTELVLEIDSNIAYLNDEEIELDVPAEIMSNRTVVPLRFIVESMGLELEWDEETETIEITDEEVISEEEQGTNDEIVNEEEQTTDGEVVPEDGTATDEQITVDEEPTTEENTETDTTTQQDTQTDNNQLDETQTTEITN